LNESFGVKNYYGYYAKLDENRFLKDADSIYQIKLDFLNKHKDSLNEEFYFIEYNDIKYGYLNKIAQYEALKRFVMDNNEFTVSVNYPNPFNKVDLTNDLLLNSRNYLDFVDLHIAKITTERINGFDSVDYQIAFLETIKKEIKSTKLKEIMVFKTSISSIDYTEELDRYYGLAKSVLTNESHILELTYKYNKLKRLSKGAASPNFELKDINGNVYNLNDFKGKYVYIDIWATWCLPCLKEIPALMELEKEYKQIQFVSICKDDERESWEKMVKDKQLKGIQLFSSDENISFFEEYMVRGIPRFILIDDNGKIIDANAMRPSNPDIKKVFDDLK